MSFLASTVLCVFFAWGIYTLHRRFRRQDELSPLVEAATLVGVILFYAVEIEQLREWTRSQPLTYVFTVLGLFVAGLALYGHMAISLTSRVIVDIIVPGGESVQDRPRFGPAEMLEREKDFDGALQEYLVLARVFPRHPQVHQRIAECLIRLARPGESVRWLERALKHTDSDDKALPVVSRLCEVHARFLEQPVEAQRVLEMFLAAYPNSQHAASVRERIQSLGGRAPEKHALELQALSEAPLTGAEPAETRVKKPRKPAAPKAPMPGLEALESFEPLSEAPQGETPDMKSETPRRDQDGPSSLEPM